MSTRLKLSLPIIAGFILVSGATHALAGLAGQRTTCGKGPKHRAIELRAVEKAVDIGQGLKTQAWTFEGTVPGPTIEACEGDTISLPSEEPGLGIGLTV